MLKYIKSTENLLGKAKQPMMVSPMNQNYNQSALKESTHYAQKAIKPTSMTQNTRPDMLKTTSYFTSTKPLKKTSNKPSIGSGVSMINSVSYPAHDASKKNPSFLKTNASPTHVKSNGKLNTQGLEKQRV